MGLRYFDVGLPTGEPVPCLVCGEMSVKLSIEITSRDGAVVFAVRVQPRASKNEISGEIGGAIKVRLQAPALEDRANQALVEILAKLLKTPQSAVRILSGHRSRNKRVEVRGVTEKQILDLLLMEA